MLTLVVLDGQKKLVIFDPATGKQTPCFKTGHVALDGNTHTADSRIASLYLDHSVLYFHLDNQRWPINDPNLRLFYTHDVTSKTTLFRVMLDENQTTITYPAWWSSMGDFAFRVPRVNEENDYLAYIVEVWENEPLQQQLIQAIEKGDYFLSIQAYSGA